jgi:hypothetical protein
MSWSIRRAGSKSALIGRAAEKPVHLAVCIIMTTHANWDIWADWAAGTNVGFVTHPLPGSPGVPFSVEHPIATKWGERTLVDAELLLYRTAVSRFPHLKTCLFVSGDTVPIVGANDMLLYYRNDHRSHFKEYTDMDKTNAVKKKRGTKPKFIQKYFVSDQFKALAKADIDILLHGSGQDAVQALLRCTFYTPRRKGSYKHDEIVIPTVLYNTFEKKHFNNNHILGVTRDGSHAKSLLASEFVSLWNEEKHDSHVQIIRKVGSTEEHQIAEFLRAKNIIS